MHRTYLPCGLCLAALLSAPALAQTLTLTTSSTEQELAMLQQVGQEAFRALGLELKLLSVPAERSLQMADSGQSDGDGLRVRGLEATYTNLVPVPESFMDTEFSAVVHNPEIRQIHGWEGLGPYRVGMIRGWKIVEQKSRGAQKVYAAVDYSSLFNMLAYDRIDVAVYTRPDVPAILAELKLPQLRLLEPPLDSQPMVLYLHRSHQALVPALDRELKAMKQDGRWEAIRARVFSPESVSETPGKPEALQAN